MGSALAVQGDGSAVDLKISSDGPLAEFRRLVEPFSDGRFFQRLFAAEIDIIFKWNEIRADVAKGPLTPETGGWHLVSLRTLQAELTTQLDVHQAKAQLADHEIAHEAMIKMRRELELPLSKIISVMRKALDSGDYSEIKSLGEVVPKTWLSENRFTAESVQAIFENAVQRRRGNASSLDTPSRPPSDVAAA